MSVFKNGLFLSLAKFSEKIISFLIVVIASRYYGAEGIGEFFYYFSLVSLFIPLMDLGFEKLMMHEWYDTSKSEKEKLNTTTFLSVISTYANNVNSKTLIFRYMSYIKI